ncbi:MAG: FliA/WhiG family RNA polymerase sigma factor [Zetaproteobacteria bacterium]|nr:FliA/WhiG family RNA polymerase sigma factor [Zetaproteobacteria bacterium]
MYSRTGKSASKNSHDALIREHLPAVHYFANQLRSRTGNTVVEYDDLVQSGLLGLMDAIQRFDESRGVKLATFVGLRIRGAMIDYLRSCDWLPRSVRESSSQIKDALIAVEQRTGRIAEEEDIAAELGISLQEYRERLQNVRDCSVIYFDELPGADDDSNDDAMSYAILEDGLGSAENQIAMMQFIDQLAGAIEKLPMNERIILTLYYYEELSMKEIAEVMGRTESRISQLHGQMVIRIRQILGLADR